MATVSSAASASAATTAPPVAVQPRHSVHEKMSKGPSKIGMLIFAGVLIGGLIFIGSSIARDLSGLRILSSRALILAGIAPPVGPGFGFVNGFHDTANAVATVIY